MDGPETRLERNRAGQNFQQSAQVAGMKETNELA
jgi:hypothetical protein